MTELRIGDQVVYQGRIFWLRLIINMPNGTVLFGLQQSHWKQKEWYLVVNRTEVLLDPPYCA